MSIVLYKFNNFPVSININLFWNVGFLLFIMFIIQVLSGLFISVGINFSQVLFSKLTLMNESYYSWLFIKIHITLSQLIFFIILLHIFKSLFFSLFNSFLLWVTGFVLLVFYILSSFLGYCSSGGLMGYYGITIGSGILGFFTGKFITYSLFYDYSVGVSSFSLNKFFIFHMSLSYLMLFFIFIHLLVLHVEGSSNSLVIWSYDCQRFGLIRVVCDLEFLFVSFIIYFLFLFLGNFNYNQESFRNINGKVLKTIDLYVFVRVLFLLLKSFTNKSLGVLISSLVFLYLLFISLVSVDMLGKSLPGSMYIVLFLFILYIVLFSNLFFSSIIVIVPFILLVLLFLLKINI